MMRNKKGAEPTILGYVIAIVLLVALVVLVFFVATGRFGEFGDSISQFFGGKVNVQTVVQGCQAACASGGQFDFCQKIRDVSFDKKLPKEQLTCVQLVGRNVGLAPCENIAC